MYGHSSLKYNLLNRPLQAAETNQKIITPFETGIYAQTHTDQTKSVDAIYTVPDEKNTYSIFNETMISLTCRTALVPDPPTTVKKKFYFLIPVHQILSFEMMKIISVFNSMIDCQIVRIPRHSDPSHYNCSNISL